MKDTSVIPKGVYCYTLDKTGKQVTCPYWRRIKERGKQEDGWCDYLEKGDVELVAEGGFFQMGEDNQPILDTEIGFSLLWDMCKECGVNDDEN